MDLVNTPLSEGFIKDLCDVSYGGDLMLMKKNYQVALKNAKAKTNLKQIKIFTRELKTINRMVRDGNNEKSIN